MKDAKFAPMMASLLARKGQAAPSVLAPPEQSIIAPPAPAALMPETPPPSREAFMPAPEQSIPAYEQSAAPCEESVMQDSPDFSASGPTPGSVEAALASGLDVAALNDNKKDRVLRQAFDAYFGRSAF